MQKLLILAALTALTACATQQDGPWTNLGSYEMGGKRICTYQRGDATGTAVVTPTQQCPVHPD